MELSNNKLRLIINSKLRDSLLEENGLEIENKVLNHIDNCLAEFGAEIKKVVLESGKPYIRYYLDYALATLKKHFFSGLDELFL